MGKLEELEEELYGKDEGEEAGRRMKRRVLFPGALSKAPTNWGERESPGRGVRMIPADGRLLKLFFWGLAAVIIIGGSLFLFLYLGTRGQEAEVIIQGRERVEAGEEVSVPIVVRNVSRTVLREVELAVLFPEGFLIRDERGAEYKTPPRLTKSIPDLAPGKEMELVVSARVFGREAEEKKLEATALYRPENLRARFSAKTSFIFTISRVPLAISWDMPDTFSSGDNFDFKVRYSSTARGPFEDMSLRLDYPPGFTFVSASPSPSTGNNIWNIGTVGPDQQGIIAVRGTMRGAGGEVKTVTGGAGKFNVLTKEWRPYVESSHETKVVLAPLSIEAALEGTREKIISPGDRLVFTLHYKNNTDLTLKNISVEASLEGLIIELDKLSLEDGGVFDGTRSVLLWGPGGTEKLREIQPGEEGDLRFDVSTRERPPVRGATDQNLIVRLHSKIEAKTVPSGFAGNRAGSEDNLEFKVRSKILFTGRALHPSSPVATVGPLPPKVGVKTSYAISWEVRNFTNTLSNVNISAALPPNVTWENMISPDAHITYDQQAGEVHWRAGQVNAGRGVLSPALTSYFLVSILPSEADAGRALTLLRDVKLAGHDTFTDENVEVRGEPITTELKEDPATSGKDWIVVK